MMIGEPRAQFQNRRFQRGGGGFRGPRFFGGRHQRPPQYGQRIHDDSLGPAPAPAPPPAHGSVDPNLATAAVGPRPAYRFKPTVTITIPEEGYGKRLRKNLTQAHDCAIRAMAWSHSEQWLVSADHDGYLKYWQCNMNNVKMYQAHKEAVRGISFCPTDTKFATASDDGTARVWDFAKCTEERILRGHGSDVRTVDWHPTKALLATGSRDSQQPVKLWEPKSGQCLSTLHDHKNGVMDLRWNANGHWLASASRDHLVKIYDIRMMKELQTLRGHRKEVISLTWHPVHESLLTSGGSDGSIIFWQVGIEKEVGLIDNAHEQTIWHLAWHPLGHILASGSNDNNTKFWARNKPGDSLEEFYGIGGNGPLVHDIEDDDICEINRSAPLIPGMGIDAEVTSSLENRLLAQQQENKDGGIPGLGGLSEGGYKSSFPQPNIIKRPFVKPAQREFEKVWTAHHGGSGGNDYFDLRGSGASFDFGPRPNEDNENITSTRNQEPEPPMPPMHPPGPDHHGFVPSGPPPPHRPPNFGGYNQLPPQGYAGPPPNHFGGQHPPMRFPPPPSHHPYNGPQQQGMPPPPQQQPWLPGRAPRPY